MYTIYLYNFGYSIPELYATLDEAMAAGRKTGFQFNIIDKSCEIVYSTATV
ncbi:MAG: hypothetical protein WCH05_06535 [Chlorobiaceae bacterium]